MKPAATERTKSVFSAVLLGEFCVPQKETRHISLIHFRLGCYSQSLINFMCKLMTRGRRACKMSQGTDRAPTGLQQGTPRVRKRKEKGTAAPFPLSLLGTSDLFHKSFDGSAHDFLFRMLQQQASRFSLKLETFKRISLL